MKPLAFQDLLGYSFTARESPQSLLINHQTLMLNTRLAGASTQRATSIFHHAATMAIEGQLLVASENKGFTTTAIRDMIQLTPYVPTPLFFLFHCGVCVLNRQRMAVCTY